MKTWIMLMQLAVLLLGPHVGFRVLPVYPVWLEKLMGAYFDTLDQFWEKMDIFGQNPLHFVNNGAHFMEYFEKDSNFFEGWYYKMVSKDRKATAVIIPGFFFGGNHNLTEDHTFFMISVILQDDDGKITHKSVERIMFPYDQHKDDLSAHNSNTAQDDFIVKFGKNIFTQDSIHVETPDYQIEVKFKNSKRYPGGIINPNTMGWFSYIDYFFGMQCVHKVVSLNSRLEGWFNTSEHNINLADGVGYIEGDHGSEFPEKYVWMQSNHFLTSPGSSVFLSFATLPLPNEKNELLTITGFTGVVYDGVKDKVYKFGTWGGSTLTVLSESATEVSVEVDDGQYRMSITALGSKDKISLFWGPKFVNGEFKMREYIKEMLDSQIQVIIFRKSTQKVIFEGIGMNGALEIQN